MIQAIEMTPQCFGNDIFAEVIKPSLGYNDDLK